MLKHLRKFAGAFARIYGEPGAGVTVYTTPDSLSDFYRIAGVNAPFWRPNRKSGAPAQRRLWIWGGGAAVHQTRLTVEKSGQTSACMDC